MKICNFNNVIYWIVVLLLTLMGVRPVAALDGKSNFGTDFWMTNSPRGGGNCTYSGGMNYIIINGDDISGVSITGRGRQSYVGESVLDIFTEQFSLLPNEIRTYTIPFSMAGVGGIHSGLQIGTPGGGRGVDFLNVKSTSNVAVHMQNFSCIAEAALILPTNALGTEYIIPAYRDLYHGSSFAKIVVIEDGTVINARLTENTYHPDTGLLIPAGENYTFLAGKGETVILKGLSIPYQYNSRDITGSSIRSNKRIAVFAGGQHNLQEEVVVTPKYMR